jgi:hypothetical protein
MRPAAARLGLALLWWVAAAALLALAAALAAGLALGAARLAGGEIGEVQRSVWLALARTIGATALAPLALATVVLWCAAATRWPTLDTTWRALAPGTVALALLAFPPVGAWVFTAWSPGTTLDYLGTWALVAGGVAAALLLARLVVPGLGPGAFSGAPGALRGGAAEGPRAG